MKLFLNIIRKYSAPFLLICTFFFLSMQAGFAQSGTRAGVFGVPEIRPGVLVEVPVEIRDVSDLYAFDIELSFDPDYLEFDDADPNKAGIQPGFGTFLDPGVTIVNIIDPDQGVIHVVVSQINPSQPKSGSGNLLVLYLTGLRTGQTSLDVTKVELSTRYGEAIAVSGVDAEIKIVTGAPIITATPIPVINPIEITALPTLDPSKIPPTPTLMPSVTPMPTRTATSLATQTRTATATAQATQANTATNAPTATLGSTAVVAPTATLAPGATLAPTATLVPTAAESEQPTLAAVVEVGETPTAEPTALEEVGSATLTPAEAGSNEGRVLAKDNSQGMGKALPWLIGGGVLLIISAGIYFIIRKTRGILKED